MSQNQQACIAEMWQDKSWNLHFRRDFNDWELGIIADLLVTINQFKYLSEEGDSLVWEGESGRGLTVSSAYNLFVPTGSEIVDWPWKMIWKAKIPYKVNCFTWLLAKEAILTHDNLNKRGHHLCSRCFLCEDQRETVNHLFLHCTRTEQLWQMFINKRKITWVRPGRIKDVLKNWNRDGKQIERRRDGRLSHLAFGGQYG